MTLSFLFFLDGWFLVLIFGSMAGLPHPELGKIFRLSLFRFAIEEKCMEH